MRVSSQVNVVPILTAGMFIWQGWQQLQADVILDSIASNFTKKKQDLPFNPETYISRGTLSL